jgi:hypothetical protein
MTPTWLELALIDGYLPVYDTVLTEHMVIDADRGAVYLAARDLDFMKVRSPLLSASFFVRTLPARLTGKEVPAPPVLRLGAANAGLPGWLYLGDRPGHEVAFGAVGKFWQPNITWRDVPLDAFAGFAEPGWGKIACQFLMRDSGPGRTVLTYECRTATTDSSARTRMARYWWLIRPFVAHIMRATLRTIARDADGNLMMGIVQRRDEPRAPASVDATIFRSPGGPSQS